MLTIVFCVPLITLLFLFLSEVNLMDLSWVDSTLRTSVIWLGIVVVSAVAFLEAKFFDKKFIEVFCKFFERGGINDD